MSNSLKYSNGFVDATSMKSDELDEAEIKAP